MNQTLTARAAAAVTRPEEREARCLPHARTMRTGIALLLAATMMPATAGAATRVTCSPTAVTAVFSDTFRSTTSTTFVPLDEAGAKFVQGGSQPSCVLVRFEGYVATADNTVISISASIGNKTLPPIAVQLAHNAVVYQPRGWTFVIPNVKPGDHRIKFTYRTNSGNSVSFNATSTIIHHAP